MHFFHGALRVKISFSEIIPLPKLHCCLLLFFCMIYFGCVCINIPLNGRIFKLNLSYDVASGSEITPCNKIDKVLVVYRFSGNIMTSIIMFRT